MVVVELWWLRWWCWSRLVIGKSRDMRSFEVFKINRRKSHFDVLNLKKNDLKMRNDEKNHVDDHHHHGYVSTLKFKLNMSHCLKWCIYVCSAVRWRVELHRVASIAGLDFVAHVTYLVLEPRYRFESNVTKSGLLPLVAIKDNNFQNGYRQQLYWTQVEAILYRIFESRRSRNRNLIQSK